MMGIFGPVLSASATNAGLATPPYPSSTIGTCVREGNITLTIAGQTRNGENFVCPPEPSVLTTASGTAIQFLNGTTKSIKISPNSPLASLHSSFAQLARPSYTGKNNYQLSWTSGNCNSSCTATDVKETSTMSPNSTYWDDQDNAYSLVLCDGVSYADTIFYQNVADIGTSSNSYDNVWGITNVNYNFYCTATYTETTPYYFLQYYNLNSGYDFVTWFTINSSGVPTGGGLEVYDSSTTLFYQTQSMPSNNPNVGIEGWENVIVCENNGCYTQFSGGGGNMTYYQANIGVYSPGNPTQENSNCSYSTITTVSSFGLQTFSC